MSEPPFTRDALSAACAGEDLAAAQRIAAGLLAAKGGTAATEFAARQVAAMSERLALPESRVAILASFTVDPLAPHLAVQEFLKGRRLAFLSIAYDQWHGALTATGALDAFAPDLALLLLHLEDAVPLLARRHLAASDALDEETAHLCDAINTALGAFRTRSAAPVALSTFIAAERGVERFFDRRVEPSRQGRIDRINGRIADIAAAHDNVFVFDYAACVTDFGRCAWFDPIKAHHVMASVAARAHPHLARELSGFISALRRPRKKVLALDLDNTLWGGIVGEDGPEGIVASGDYPGNAFADFQSFLANLRASGVALALVSKNNEADAEEAFRLNPGMPLRWEDFAARRVDWNDKAASLKALAADINVSVDSLVFADDNPLECDLVRNYAPEVEVVELGGVPSLFPQHVLAGGGFYAAALTGEDRGRAESYVAEHGRRTLAVSATDTGDFLARLNLKLTLRPPRDGEVERIAQLFGKTNQFNLTTKRYGVSEVIAMREDSSTELKVALLSDRYGDYGLIGVVVIRDGRAGVREIDSFLMSCRALGRGVERDLLADVERDARAAGVVRLIGRYRPSAKNGLVADFYPEHGFRDTGEAGVFERDLAVTEPFAFSEHTRIIRAADAR